MGFVKQFMGMVYRKIYRWGLYEGFHLRFVGRLWVYSRLGTFIVLVCNPGGCQ